MSDIDLEYDKLMPMYQDYHDTYTALYRLHTYDEDELLQIYQMVKTNLIDKNVFMPYQILEQISKIFKYNNRYLKSYWFIFKKIYEEYKPEKIDNISTAFNYFVYQEYGTILSFRKKPRFKYMDNLSINIHEENSIFSAIMYDDVKSFIGLTQNDNFNESQQLCTRYLYPHKKYQRQSDVYSFIELCCYLYPQMDFFFFD